VAAIGSTVVVDQPVVLAGVRARAVEVRTIANTMGPCIIPAEADSLHRTALEIEDVTVIAHCPIALEFRQKCDVLPVIRLFNSEFSSRGQVGKRGALPIGSCNGGPVGQHARVCSIVEIQSRIQLFLSPQMKLPASSVRRAQQPIRANLPLDAEIPGRSILVLDV